MLRTMVTATNTLSQLQIQLDNISNNIANNNTVGYKAKQANFAELLYQQYDNDKLDKTMRQSPVGIRYGVGTYVSQIQANQKQGTLQTTERDLDFAFTKEGLYFNVSIPNGDEMMTAFTRQGNFYVSPTGNGEVMLVTAEGHSVMDSDGNPIYLPENATNFKLNQNGVLQATYEDGNVLSVELGVTQLQKPQSLEHLTGAYFGLPSNLEEAGLVENEIITPLIGEGRSNVEMSQGVLELSNVNLSAEMTNLIAAQRSYQFHSRAVTMGDQMLGLINGIR